MAPRTLRYEVEDHVATLTLARPERLNALNRAMVEELLEAFDRADGDPDIRAVIVTGEGRAFCAGFDLDGAAAFDVGAGTVNWQALPPDHPIRDLGGRLALRIFDSAKPVIGAINGAAVGIGATMLLPMDYRLAAAGARVGFVFGRRGIVPEAASGWFLPRVVGISRALDWCLSGKLVPAEEALAAGLLHSVHDAADLLPAARTIAREIVANIAPVSATLIRHLMWRGLTLDHPMEAHRIDSRLMAERGAHADSREGVSAFLEKRPAQFQGTVPGDLPATYPWWRDRPFS